MMTEPLTNLQIELLKLYSTNLNEDELKQVKNVLANYFAERGIKEADRIWERKGLSNQEMEIWLNEHR